MKYPHADFWRDPMHLGFKFGKDEYKIMGLAPHGRAEVHIAKMRSLVRLRDGGTYAIPILNQNRTLEEKQTYGGTLRELEALFGAARKPGAHLAQDHQDIAAALQKVYEETLMHTLMHFAQETGHRSLCFAGGCALNCTANGLVRRSGLFDRMFIQPAAGDDGSALGAALYLQHAELKCAHPRQMAMPFWGPEYGRSAMQHVMASLPSGLRVTSFASFDELVAESARRLADGLTFGWFQGRMEFGPRALGNRSILADPRPARMREKINRIIKKREGFRPFAPAVAAGEASLYFDIEPVGASSFAHMLYVSDVKECYREALPAITHVDGSARVQTVSREDNERFWKLLKEFEKHSGFPILLNTSFNVQEPIVCTPADALRTFMETDLDVLVLGEHLMIERRRDVDVTTAQVVPLASPVPATRVRGESRRVVTLGYSGLDNSVAFKREAFPHLHDERCYRIAQGFDSAAALLIDGEVVAAAAEERFTRELATGAFPVQAIRYCLDEAGLTLDDVDHFAHNFSTCRGRAVGE